LYQVDGIIRYSHVKRSTSPPTSAASAPRR
jgi:hypothetical protein